MALGEDLVNRDNREPATPTLTHTIPTSPSTSGTQTPQLALPLDLWQDFQALQAATHLDTTSLIRRLIHQYDRGSQDEGADRPASATDTDTTTLSGDHHAALPCGNQDKYGPGELTSFGEAAASYGGEMALITAGYPQASSLSTGEDYLPTAGLTCGNEEDGVILDLSSGVRDAQNSLSAARASTDVKTGCSDETEDGETPLDLSVSKCRRSAYGKTKDDTFVTQAPEAHTTPSNTLLLSALSHGLLHTAAASPPTARPREAHSVTPGTAPSPRPVSSSLFNLSELPFAGGPKVSFAAQADQPRSKASVSSCSGWSEELQSKQKIVQHFLSLPTGHLMPSEAQQGTDVHEKQRCVLKLNPSSSEPFRHFALTSSIPNPTSSPSTHRYADHSGITSTSTAMQLPTVTSLEFHGTGSVGNIAGGGEEEGVTQPSLAVTLPSLPTSASAILLDVTSGGLVTGAGGGVAGVSTLNIPLMATGTGGLVAIPLLHPLPEALAAATAAAPAQGQLPATSSSTPLIGQPPLSSQPVNDIPPPPPYSAAIAASAQSKKYKAKMGRPRGLPKVQKAAPKDMKLLTENTLFPGVYTSILKLPWSKRSRGKSSVKIKDVIGNANSSVTASVPEQQSDTKQRETGEITAPVRLQQGQAQASSTVSTDTVPLSILPMPLFVPELTSAASSTLSSSSTSSSSSTASVMMVYHNSVMSEVGKPLRKRGRPPKLPVLSQLLTENSAYREHIADNDQPTSMDTGGLSFIPLTSHPAFDPSTVAFPANGVHSSATDFAASGGQEPHANIKQEPMEVVEALVTPLFPSVSAVSEGIDDTGRLPPDHHRRNQNTTRETDITMATRPDNMKDVDVRCADVSNANVRDEKVRDTNGCGADVRDAAISGGHYGCKETSEGGGAERGDGGNTTFQDATLETRFHMLANQLGLEIGSPYHTSLVYGQSPTAAAKNCLYQPMMLSPQAMVEMKPRRRQLNNLIKPSDDCVYTSFRIRPRNSGRRGGKRGGRRRGSSVKCNSGKLAGQHVPVTEDCQANELYYKEGYDSSRAGSGSAVITERIPGAGEVPQRLYQDLYHCKACNELLPVDNSLPHTCTSPASPPLRACDMCGTMFLSTDPQPEEPVLPSLCEDCARKSQQLPSPVSTEDNPQDCNVSDGFACQPCGVHFVNISDYIQHRRTAHLDKMSRQARKTHTLKTLPCPTRGCPRLFHMHAELSRHLRNDHPEEGDQKEARGEGGDTSPTPSTSQQDHPQDVDVETTSTKETESAEEEHPQFLCSQAECGQPFPTPLQLLEHVQTCHEGISQWPCPLPGCSRLFSAERHLRVHLLMHKDEKPLKCPFCHYRCRQKNALHWHMRKHPECAGQYRKFAGMAADS